MTVYDLRTPQTSRLKRVMSLLGKWSAGKKMFSWHEGT